MKIMTTSPYQGLSHIRACSLLRDESPFLLFVPSFFFFLESGSSLVFRTSDAVSQPGTPRLSDSQGPSQLPGLVQELRPALGPASAWEVPRRLVPARPPKEASASGLVSSGVCRGRISCINQILSQELNTSGKQKPDRKHRLKRQSGARAGSQPAGPRPELIASISL